MSTLKHTLLAAIIAVPTLMIAQKPIDMTEADKEMSMGNKHCYIMTIPQTKGKDVTEAWKKYIKKDAKGKLEEANGEMKMIGAMYKNISSLPFNAFAKVLETPEGTQLTGWFSEGEIFISTATAADKSTAVQKYMHDFGVQEYKASVAKELEKENNKLKDLQKVLEGFGKNQKGADGNVENYKKEIEKLQNKIKEEQGNSAKAVDSQTKSKGDVDAQQAVIKEVTDRMNNIK
jgi:hypothetical protein